MKTLKPFDKKFIVEILKEEQRTIRYALEKAEYPTGDVGFMQEVFSLMEAIKQLELYIKNISWNEES